MDIFCLAIHNLRYEWNSGSSIFITPICNLLDPEIIFQIICDLYCFCSPLINFKCFCIVLSWCSNGQGFLPLKPQNPIYRQSILNLLSSLRMPFDTGRHTYISNPLWMNRSLFVHKKWVYDILVYKPYTLLWYFQIVPEIDVFKILFASFVSRTLWKQMNHRSLYSIIQKRLFEELLCSFMNKNKLQFHVTRAIEGFRLPIVHSVTLRYQWRAINQPQIFWLIYRRL